MASHDRRDYAPRMSHHGLTSFFEPRSAARITRLALLLALPLGLTGCPDDAAPIETESPGSTTTGDPPTTSISPTTTTPGESSDSSSSSSSSGADTTADTTADTSATGPTEECGNGIIEGDEVCDGENLDGEDCITRGFDGGELACAGSCTGYDTSSCTSITCGNDIADPKEACDGTDLAGSTCDRRTPSARSSAIGRC